MSSPPTAVDRSTATQYRWGDGCDGWPLLAHEALRVIEERVPAGAAEVRHVHHVARQFFYILAGEGTIEAGGTATTLTAGQGLHVPPGVPHRFANHSTSDVVFLVISSPTTIGDREEL